MVYSKSLSIVKKPYLEIIKKKFNLRFSTNLFLNLFILISTPMFLNSIRLKLFNLYHLKS
jgi:hypothetical protein